MLDTRSSTVWADEASTRRPMQPLWWQLANVSLTFALVDGFGAYSQLFSLTPLKYVAVQAMLLLATLILSPPRSLTRVYLPLTSLLFVAWWIASYLWEKNRAGWVSISSRDLATITTIVVLAQVLGREDFVRALLRSGYIAIALVFFALAVQPSSAFVTFGPAPGLRGGFIHKNTMAPCLLLMVAVVLCCRPHVVFRRLFAALVVAMVYFAQTTTGFATLAMVLLIYMLLGRYKSAVQRLGRSAGSLLMAGALVGCLVAAEMFASAVRLSGKDLTFSNRTVIWDGVTDAINQRFWHGYGYGVWENIWVDPIRGINVNNGFFVAHAHNAALDLMLRLGAVGLALYLLILLATIRSGWRGLLNDDQFGRLALLTCAIVISFGFSEALPAYGVWPGLLIAFTTLSRRGPSSEPIVGTRP